MEVWSLMNAKRSEELCSALLWLSYRAVFLHEVIWFMSVSLRITDRRIWWSCKHSHEDWSKESGNNSKNNSFSLTKIDDSHDFYVAKDSLFRKYSWSCTHSNSELFDRLLDKSISEDRQLDHRSENRETVWCWQSSQFQNTHGAQGIYIYLIQNTYAHKGETCFLPEYSEDSSYTNLTGRIVPCDVFEKSTY